MHDVTSSPGPHRNDGREPDADGAVRGRVLKFDAALTPAAGPTPLTPVWVGWVSPILALIVVGASTSPAPYGPTRNLVNEIAAFAISVVTMGLWRVAEHSATLRARISK